MDPCAVPYVTGVSVDLKPLTVVLCWRQDMYSNMNFWDIWSRPYYSSFLARIWWSIVSNAREKINENTTSEVFIIPVFIEIFEHIENSYARAETLSKTILVLWENVIYIEIVIKLGVYYFFQQFTRERDLRYRAPVVWVRT